MISRTIEQAIESGDGNPALLDTATGALSPAAFTLRLEEAAALAGRLGHGLSVVVVDLCAPWTLCRAHGDETVDAVLAQIVDRIWDRGRRSDIVARLGAGRLAIIQPGTFRQGAEHYATRLLARLSAAPYRIGTGHVVVLVDVTVVGTALGEIPSARTLLDQLEEQG